MKRSQAELLSSLLTNNAIQIIAKPSTCEVYRTVAMARLACRTRAQHLRFGVLQLLAQVTPSSARPDAGDLAIQSRTPMRKAPEAYIQPVDMTDALMPPATPANAE
jgi:hypothetical protein